MLKPTCSFVVACIGIACTLIAPVAHSEETLRGKFAGPVSGLRFETPTQSGVTGKNGEYVYRDGEVITFLIGDLVLGKTKGAVRVNESLLASRVNGNIDKLHDPVLVNISRLLHSLDQDGLLENGVQIADQAHSVMGDRALNLSGRLHGLTEKLDAKAFAEDPAVAAALVQLNNTAGVFSTEPPRTLVTAAQARNQVRRNIRGIIKTIDVQIPLRDGSFVFADVFRPADGEKYPVVMNLGVYGKAFNRECICNAQDALEKEELEDRFFSGNPDGAIYENHETADTSVWVPEGYVVVRVDTRGTCRSPGQINIFSRQEAEDFYDSIEWSAKQPWSNGNVGLWGMSYYAITQHNVASLQPPSLKAMIPAGTDTDSYVDILYNGGIRNEEFATGWWDHTKTAVCGDLDAKDFLSISRDNPFREDAFYGARGSIFMSPDLSKVTVPQWVTAPTTHLGHIHVSGSHKAYINSASEHKKLDIATDWFVNNYNSVPEHIAFFDYWLKGIDNGIMGTPPVRIRIRTGNDGYYERYEDEWPIARTQYTRYYLDSSQSNWSGDGRRNDSMRLTSAQPKEPGQASYSAEVDVGNIYPHEPGADACWASGVSYITEPMSEDMELAGYMKLGMWVSSTSSDMDIFASVRVLDESNQEINFSGIQEAENRENETSGTHDVYPVGIGWLKVSHRKLDVSETTDYLPVHTHAESDYAPLKNSEVVPVEVALWPNTALIKKGHRVRLDIQPHDGCGHGSRHSYDPSYHTDAENTVYTGPARLSYLQLPIIPNKE
jgi:predicted acyl esterase